MLKLSYTCLSDDSKISHKNYSGSVGSIRVPSDNALLNGNPFLLGDTVHEEEDVSVATDFPPSPKYTTTEKWIIDQQKRKLFTEKTWALKQQRTQQRITACSDKLKVFNEINIFCIIFCEIHDINWMNR